MVSLPRSVSPMFLNNIIFSSDRISMISNLLTHPKPSSIENLLLSNSDLTCLDMGLGELSIKYMSHIHSISQQMCGFSMEQIIPLFSIAGLDHNQYPGVTIRYLASDPALVNCNLLDISGLVYGKDTRQQSLILLSSTHMAMVNCVSDVQSQPPLTGFLQPHPSHPTTTTSPVDYPPPRGVPWERIAAMVHSDT